MSLDTDLAGSRSKNRFRLELLWGVSKMIDIHKQNVDYSVVFDFKCDIEIHKDNEFEFYQIKTIKNGNFTPKKLCTIKKGKLNSILGNLYALYSPNEKIKLAVVCNQPLKDKSKIIESDESCFAELDSETIKYVKEQLCNELKSKNIVLDDIFYIYDGMDFKNPEAAVFGKLIKSFEEIKGEEPNNPNALYRLVLDAVKEKSTYEFDIDNYEEIIKKKAITSSDFEKMLNAHSKESKTGMKETKKYIENIKSIKKKRQYNLALIQIIDTNMINAYFRLTVSIFEFIRNNEDDFNDIEIAMTILEKNFDKEFSSEITEEMRNVYYLYIYNLYASGGNL